MPFVGSTLLVVYVIAKAAYASVAFNLVWAAVGLYGLAAWYGRWRHGRKIDEETVAQDEKVVL